VAALTIAQPRNPGSAYQEPSASNTAASWRAGAADPSALGQQLLMLVEGATVVADHYGTAQAGREAGLAALTLLRTASPSSGDDHSRPPA
jgi:hypothetical protein